MQSSMSRKGDCWDNAPTEGFWGRLKVGRLCGKKFVTRRLGMDEVNDWMTFYNRRRIQSTLGYVSPMQYEKSWHAAQLLKAAYLNGLEVRPTAAVSDALLYTLLQILSVSAFEKTQISCALQPDAAIPETSLSSSQLNLFTF